MLANIEAALHEEVDQAIDQAKKILTSFNQNLNQNYVNTVHTEEYNTWFHSTLIIIKKIHPDFTENFIKLSRGMTNLHLGPIQYNKSWVSEEIYVNDPTGNAKMHFERGIHAQLGILRACKTHIFSKVRTVSTETYKVILGAQLKEASYLLDSGYTRAAGAVAGVVLESHIKSVLDGLGKDYNRERITLNPLAQLLRNENLINLADFKIIEAAAETRNNCTHAKLLEPEPREVAKLLEHVEYLLSKIK